MTCLASNLNIFEHVELHQVTPFFEELRVRNAVLPRRAPMQAIII